MLKGLPNLSASHTNEIVADETFVAGDTDFQAEPLQMKGKKTFALVMFLYYIEAGKIVKTARGVWELTKIVGGDGFTTERSLQQTTAEKKYHIYLLSRTSTTM